MPHHTRVAGMDGRSHAAGLPVARREITRAVRLWGEPADVRDAVTQVTGELFAAVRDGQHLEVRLRRLPHAVRITVLADHVPPPSITDEAFHRAKLLLALTSRIRIHQVGHRRACCCDVPAATPRNR